MIGFAKLKKVSWLKNYHGNFCFPYSCASLKSRTLFVDVLFFFPLMAVL